MRFSGFALMLLGMAVAAQAAESENRVLFLNPDLPTVQIVQFESVGGEHAKPYRLSLNIVPIPSSDTAPFGPGFDSTSRLTAVIDRQKDIAWAASANSAGGFASTRASLLSLLRFESKGERIELRPRRHSLSIEWRKTFH